MEKELSALLIEQSLSLVKGDVVVVDYQNHTRDLLTYVRKDAKNSGGGVREFFRPKLTKLSDLESLSATALYYGDGSISGSSAGSGWGFGGFGRIDGKDRKKYGLVITPNQNKGPSGGAPKPSLTIRDFSTMQLHIHEKDSLITGANIKGKGKEGEKFSLP